MTKAALDIMRIVDRLHYWDGLRMREWYKEKNMSCYPWKESHFYALGGLHSFDINSIGNTKLFQSLSTKDTSTDGVIVGIARALAGDSETPRESETSLSAEHMLMCFLTATLVRWAKEKKKGGVEEWPPMLRKALLSRFRAAYPDLPGVDDLIRKADTVLASYIENRFGNGTKPIRTAPYPTKVMMMIYPTFRSVVYADAAGTGLIRSVVVALDVLIDAGDNFENLLRYLVLSDRKDPHAVLIAGALFGLLHGHSGVPTRWLG